jgi:hypothetical protein
LAKNGYTKLKHDGLTQPDLANATGAKSPSDALRLRKKMRPDDCEHEPESVLSATLGCPHAGLRGVTAMLFVIAWIVLIVLIACTVSVIVFLAMLPGMIARKRQHPWQQAVTVAGWITLFLGFALWPVALIWAYVDVPTPRVKEAVR